MDDEERDDDAGRGDADEQVRGVEEDRDRPGADVDGGTARPGRARQDGAPARRPHPAQQHLGEGGAEDGDHDADAQLPRAYDDPPDDVGQHQHRGAELRGVRHQPAVPCTG